MSGAARSSNRGWTLVFACWLVASGSTLGVLFLSEIVGIVPCVLCWYQRIAMFPLVFILPAGLLPYDPNILRYALPLAAAGWIVSLFHVLVTAGVIPESIRPCTQGVPCTDDQIVWFGFLKIPHLSMLAFSIIVALLILTRRKEPT
jgi:disulfide bond formation protein DsbB